MHPRPCDHAAAADGWWCSDVEMAPGSRYEADLRARGYHISDVRYGSDVLMTLAIEPSEQDDLHAFIQSLTKGDCEPDFGATMWVELPA